MSRGILAGGFIVVLVGVLIALKAEEQRERAERHREAAQYLQSQVEPLRQVAERSKQRPSEEQMREIRKFRDKLEQLLNEHHEAAELGFDELADELQDEIKRVSEELKDAISQRGRAEHDHHAPPEDRLDHMHAAIEHLRHAGLHEVAEHVTERAEATERELDEHRRQQGNGELREVMEQLRDLRHEVTRLREQLESIEEKR